MYHTYPTVVLLSMPTKHTLLPVFSDSSPFLVVMSHTYERHMWLTLSFSPYIQSSPLANLTSYLPHTPDSDQLLLSSQLLSPLTWTMARSHLRAPCPFWEPPIQHMEGCFWTVDQLMPFLVQPSSAFLHTWNKIHSSLHGPWRLPPLTHCCCASPMPSTFLTNALFPLHCFDLAVLSACHIHLHIQVAVTSPQAFLCSPAVACAELFLSSSHSRALAHVILCLVLRASYRYTKYI